MDDAVRAKFSECVTLWNSAEKIIKEAELIGGALVQPSINELRYAGRWIMLAQGTILKDKTQIDKITTVEQALSYAALCCMQAKHDAVDSIVLYLHEKIDKLNERYGAHTIALYVNDYDKLLVEIADVDKAIVLSRGERENRSTLYEKITAQHLPKIAQYLLEIRAAEIHINKEIEDEIAAQAREKKDHDEHVNGLRDIADGNKTWAIISTAIAVVLFVASCILSLELAGVHVTPWTQPAAANNPSTAATPGG